MTWSAPFATCSAAGTTWRCRLSRGIKDVCQKKGQGSADFDAVCRYVPGREDFTPVFGGAFYDKDSKAVKRFDPQSFQKKICPDAQLLMRNYMMERFLERISLSEYRDKFILKGDMLVAAMVGLDARSTMDLDATVKGANVNVEDIENLISAIVSVPLDDGVKFQLKSISEIMDEAEYPGIRVNMTTTFDGVVTPLKIDISTGDAITPREIRYSFKLMLEDRSIDIWAYNLETVLAEKLETIITRTTTNTRMRDFYDIYILEQLHGNTLEPSDSP